MEDSTDNQTAHACPFLGQCSFIESHRDKLPELVQRIHQQYCTNETSRCARRQIYEVLGPNAVPPLMLPGQTDWACQIIQELGGESDSLAESTEAQ